MLGVLLLAEAVAEPKDELAALAMAPGGEAEGALRPIVVPALAVQEVGHEERQTQPPTLPAAIQTEVDAACGLTQLIASTLACGVVAPRELKVQPEGQQEAVARRDGAGGALVGLLIVLIVKAVDKVVEAHIGAEVPPGGEASRVHGLEPRLLLAADVLGRHDGLVLPQSIGDPGEVVLQPRVVEAE